jgi:hypothetical protein
LRWREFILPIKNEDKTMTTAEKTCARKVQYREAEAKALEHRTKYLLRAYKCPVCYGWHTTSMATARNASIVYG